MTLDLPLKQLGSNPSNRILQRRINSRGGKGMSIFNVKVTGETNTTKLVDAKEVYRAAGILIDPEHWVQIQGLPSATFQLVDGNDLDAIVKAAEMCAVGNRGVYFTLNPVTAGLLDPAKTNDIVRRRWLLVDCDPVRPKDANASDDEHDAALEMAWRISEGLLEYGWPLPVISDSGNGAHLLYRIDLANDDESRVLCKGVLARLGEMYDTEQVKVDRAVYDARRICKLPGTLTRKGDATEERPHRWAKLLNAPNGVATVTPEQLKSFVAGSEKKSPTETLPKSIWDLKVGDDRKKAYAQRAVEIEMARIASAPNGARNNTINDACFRLGTLVGAGAIDASEVEAMAAFMARANGSMDNEESQRHTISTIRRAIKDGSLKPRDLQFLDEVKTNGVHQPAQQTNGEKPFRVKPPEIVRMGDLMKTVFAPVKWAVPGILCEGLTVLAGKPKLGKSWWALNIALTIAAGGKALGSADTAKGEVLYLALEDRLRRIQGRAKKLLSGLDIEANNNLSIATHWPKQIHGGTGYLAEWLEKANNPRLIVVDVWAKYRAASSGRRNAYDEDYEAASEVKEMADKHDCSVLLLHHCKKGKAEDVVEEVSGTLGLSGCADGILVMERTRGENEAILHITGRDVDEQQMALVFEPETCCWKSDGDAKTRTASKIKNKILEILKKHPGGKFTAPEMTLKVDEEYDSVRKTLSRLTDEGLIAKNGTFYSWPSEPTETAFP